MLDEARAYLMQNDATAALNIVLRAVHLMHGPEASSTAAEQFWIRFAQRDRVLDDLSDLINRLSIAGSSRDDGMHSCRESSTSMVDTDVPGTLQSQAPLIFQHHNPDNDDFRRQLSALEADSYVCQKCGGVVALCRREQHSTHWCPGLQKQKGM
jgi:hypothetical protein